MATAFNVGLHILLVGSFLLFLVAMVQLVVQEPHPQEKVLRTIALVGGAVVALGAQASGVSFANFAVKALSNSRPQTAGAIFLATVIPMGAGITFGWYFNRVWKKSTAKGLRWVVFVGMLTAITFAEVYAVATKTKGVMIGTAAVPNALFIAGVVLTLLIVIDGPEGATQGTNRFAAVGDLLRGRLHGRSSAFVAGLTGEPARPRNNPFARD